MLTDLLIKLEELFSVSPLIGLGASFLAGILVSFSPCSYPLIAVTLGVIGVTSLESRVKSFFLSLLFVSGIIFVYVILGIFASFTGILLERLYLNPFTYLLLTLFFLVFGLAQLDIVKLKIPYFHSVSPLNKEKNKLSIFLFGVISGLAIIPCNFPVLGAIFGLISLKQDLIYGFFSLFLFSLGYGIIFLVLGVFTTAISNLPKYNRWFKIIRKILGVFLILIGLFFLTKTIFLFKGL
ncbi:MAG: sulfite exporter TauE/SafE family protein [Candidatus Omnitrophica bacterium]|nr:sulfite exporter TauE/SafE family protein [Candidatus Omnitrophota bacterium]MCF7894040.1 sulfite exporter TauE/SafE family protein [Candidatus Omnitrophota bacterium]